MIVTRSGNDYQNNRPILHRLFGGLFVHRDDVDSRNNLGQMNDLLTRAQVAQKTKLGVRTIDSLVATKAIPFMKIGRSVRFCPIQLEEWVKDLNNNNKSRN